MDGSSLTRRHFLFTATGAGTAALLTGCSGRSRPVLNVRPLVGAIPAQVLGQFRGQLRRSSQAATLQFLPEMQPQQLFTLLQTWKQTKAVDASPSGFLDGLPLIGKGGKARVADLVSLSDFWLQKAVQQQLIQPIDPQPITAWQQLNPRWQTLVRRNSQGQPDPTGPVWAIPYRWGSLVIAYRKDLLQQRGIQPPRDWADLWRADFSRRIALPDQARLVIGLALKRLGHSYNTTDLQAIAELEPTLRSLHQQVKVYSSDAYLQPLVLGDTWVVVGWSSDLLPLVQRNHLLAAVAPPLGTVLWADLWVRPQGATPSPSSLVVDWLNFSWQPEIALFWTLTGQATSPILLGHTPPDLPAELQQNPLLLPNPTLVQQSEFLMPLPATALTQYRDLWHRLRGDL